MPFATIVSICPFETMETKPINAGFFLIPAAEKDDFIVVHITDSSYIQRLAATDHNIRIPVAAHLIAKSIVDDFVQTTIESSDNAGPGMMWFEGKLSKAEVLAHHKSELEQLILRQTRWFENLCKKADDDFNQYHQVGLISDHQRYAAKYLGYKAEWLVDYNTNDGMVDCPACFSKIDKRAIICLHCNAILDYAKAASFGIAVPQFKEAQAIPSLPNPQSLKK